MNSDMFFWLVTTKAGIKAFQKGSYAEAETYFAQALDFARRNFPAGDERLAVSEHNLDQVAIAMGKRPPAENGTGTDCPSSQGLQTVRSWDRNYRQAVEAQNQGRYAEAELLFDTALADARLLWNSDTRLADTIVGKAACSSLTGRHHEAEKLYFEALEVNTAAGHGVHPTTASIFSALALIQIWRRRFDYARKLAWKAIELRLQIVNPDHADLGQDLHTLAAVYHAQRNYREAEPLYRHSVAILQRAYGVEHEVVQTAAKNFSKMLSEVEPGQCGKPGEGAEAMEQFQNLLNRAKET